MERGKQIIEEMAKIICNDTRCKTCIHHVEIEDCNATKIAKRLYNAGYRKERQGEWVRKDGFFVCSECDSTKPFAVIKDEIHYFGCDYCNKCGAQMKGAE